MNSTIDERGDSRRETEIGPLPASWAVAPFEDSLSIAQGQVDPKVEPYASMLHVGPENIEPGSGQLLSCSRAKDLGLISGKYQFALGDIVYSKIRPYLNKVAMPDFEGICSADMYPLRVRDGFDARFLFHYLLSKCFLQQAVPHQLRTGIPKINREQLAATAFPKPPIDEQRAIAAVLDRCRAAVAVEGRAVCVTSDLKHTATRELFTRGLRAEAQKESEIGPVPESWSVVTIDDIVLNTQYGLSVRGQPQGRFPILRMNCQDEGRVVFRELQYVDLDEATIAAFRLNDGDLLFNRTNSIEHVGRTAIFEGGRDSVFASYLVRIAVDARKCLPRYLNYYMNRREVQRDIKRLASRAVGQANINATKLRTIAFPLPKSLDEQREIVSILSAIDSKIDVHRRKRGVLEELYRALLHKLMTGEVRVGQLHMEALDAPQQPEELP